MKHNKETSWTGQLYGVSKRKRLADREQIPLHFYGQIISKLIMNLSDSVIQCGRNSGDQTWQWRSWICKVLVYSGDVKHCCVGRPVKARTCSWLQGKALDLYGENPKSARKRIFTSARMRCPARIVWGCSNPFSQHLINWRVPSLRTLPYIDKYDLNAATIKTYILKHWWLQTIHILYNHVYIYTYIYIYINTYIHYLSIKYKQNDHPTPKMKRNWQGSNPTTTSRLELPWYPLVLTHLGECAQAVGNLREFDVQELGQIAGEPGNCMQLLQPSSCQCGSSPCHKPIILDE